MDRSWHDRAWRRPPRSFPRPYSPYSRRERSLSPRGPRSYVRTAPDLYRPAHTRRRSPVAPRHTSPDRYERRPTAIVEKPGPSSLTAPTWTKIPSQDHEAALETLVKNCHPATVLRKMSYRLLEFTISEMEGTRVCTNCKKTKKQMDARRGKKCFYHPSEPSIVVNPNGRVTKTYACCDGSKLNGCEVSRDHTFGILDEAAIRELKQFAFTPPPNTKSRKRRAISLDCEMVGVRGENGREVSVLARVGAIDYITSEVLIDVFVEPEGHVIDWRTPYSGITPSLMNDAVNDGKALKGWKDTRDLLWQFIDTQTILVGHALHNDLEMLHMVHTMVVDSEILTKEAVGPDTARTWSLKDLSAELLHFLVQDKQEGHDCLEDAFAAREIVFWCLQNPVDLQRWGAAKKKVLEQAAAEKAELRKEQKYQGDSRRSEFRTDGRYYHEKESESRSSRHYEQKHDYYRPMSEGRSRYYWKRNR